jgi:hypothetical protein
MSVVQQTRLDPDKLQTALEASCDALMMLQSMELAADRGDDDDDGDDSLAHQHVREATESLRCAIVELRQARSQDASVVGLGFVVGADARLPPKP